MYDPVVTKISQLLRPVSEMRHSELRTFFFDSAMNRCCFGARIARFRLVSCCVIYLITKYRNGISSSSDKFKTKCLCAYRQSCPVLVRITYVLVEYENVEPRCKSILSLTSIISLHANNETYPIIAKKTDEIQLAT